MKFVDIHTHILWEVDDGAKSKEMTENMLKTAVDSGTETIVATPHMNRDENKDISETIKKVKKRFREFKALIKEREVNIKPELGYEVYFTYELMRIENSLLSELTIDGTTYILVELPFEYFSPTLVEGIIELRKRNVDPILVHPERVREFRENPLLLADLANNDVVVQVNSESLIDDTDTEKARFALRLIKSGVVHIVASDCHDDKNRIPDMRAAYEIVAKETSPYFAELLFYENPKRIIEDKPITEPSEVYYEILDNKSKFSKSWFIDMAGKIYSKLRGKK